MKIIEKILDINQIFQSFIYLSYHTIKGENIQKGVYQHLCATSKHW